jgi:hypothetical protein
MLYLRQAPRDLAMRIGRTFALVAVNAQQASAPSATIAFVSKEYDIKLNSDNE